jgi:starvation-inducible outer membrane lipoprotein
MTALACAALWLTGCATVPKNTDHWEYRTLTTDNAKGRSVLNRYGRSGWELVSYTTTPKGTNTQYNYVFKRPTR